MGKPSVNSYYFYCHYHFYYCMLAILLSFNFEQIVIEWLVCAQGPVQPDSNPTIQTSLMCPQVHVRYHQVSFH